MSSAGPSRCHFERAPAGESKPSGADRVIETSAVIASERREVYSTVGWRAILMGLRVFSVVSKPRHCFHAPLRRHGAGEVFKLPLQHFMAARSSIMPGRLTEQMATMLIIMHAHINP